MSEIDPRTAQERDLETLILTLLALAEVADGLVEEKLAKLRDLSERLDGDNLLEVSDALRIVLLSDLRLPVPREGYLLDISPLSDELNDPEGGPSDGVAGLGSSLAALTEVTRQALRDPAGFGQRRTLLRRLAGLVGLRPSE